MPKKIINYSSTIIYKIVCKNLNITDIYVGHTTNFVKRKSQHKYACSNPNNKAYNSKIYTTIRDNGNWDNWDLIEIEKFNCNDRNEAAARERYWYEILQAKLNKQCPNQTRKEYNNTNKEKIALKCKKYYEDNRDTLSLKQKEYYEKNKDHLIQKQKIYSENNKEKLFLYQKEYLKNKNKL